MTSHPPSPHEPSPPGPSVIADAPPRAATACASARPACPVCGGKLVEQRAKLICSRCRTVCETCCEGGPG
jgi:hypothetical protein